MTAHSANMLNAVVMIVCSFWAYLTPAYSSLTALIPAGFGIALILCGPGVKVENKIIAHIAVVLTFVILMLLIVPMRTAVYEGNTMSILRVGAMMITGFLAMVMFIRSFKEARRRREEGSA